MSNLYTLQHSNKIFNSGRSYFHRSLLAKFLEPGIQVYENYLSNLLNIMPSTDMGE
jgi:hypothetical protein